jgi:hypothetical protein
MISGHRSSLNIWCVLIGIAVAGCLTDDTADQNDMAAAAPALSKVSQAAETAPVKAFPVKPQDPPGVTTDGTLPAKPAAGPAAEIAAPWTVSLVASPPSLWPAEYTTLTATTNMDVGPTPYYIRIWDDDSGPSGTYIANCGTGTTCSISVTRPGERATSFKAVVATWGGTPVASTSTSVYWHVSGVRMIESETTAAAGTPVVLTTFTDHDISASPYWVVIQDDTARTILGICGFGTTCSVTVTQATATTHRYRACFSQYGTSYPTPNILECSPQKLVTWTGNTAVRVFLRPQASGTLTAISSMDVTNTAFAIQIFNRNGERVAICRTGTSCPLSGNLGCEDRAFGIVGLPSATMPDAPLAAARMLPMREWTAAIPSSVIGTTTGSVVSPCPSPQPRLLGN